MLFQSTVPVLFQKLHSQVYNTENTARKKGIAKRLNFYHDEQLVCLEEKLDELFSDPSKMVKIELNVVRKVINNLAQIYREPPVREIQGSDVRDRILSTDEFASLMKYAKGHTYHIIAMGYYTGMRKSEILKLTWDKVDLNQRVIHLEPGDTKDREARDVPICNELFEILRSMPNKIQRAGESNIVFQYRGKPVDDIRKGLKKACKEAGIKYGRKVKGGFVFHDLRHTFNTNMRKAGVSETVIMKITGHSTREMFDRYNTVDFEDLKKASDLISKFYSKSPVTHSVTQMKKSDKKLN